MAADRPRLGRQRSWGDKQLDAVHRSLRVDFGTVTDEVARGLLDRYTGMVIVIVREYIPASRRGLHEVDTDLLVSIGQTALLEAHIRYREGDTSKERAPGSGFSSWARRVVGWRVREAIHIFISAEPGRSSRCDSANGVLHGHTVRGPLPDERAYHHALGVWLKTCLARLEPRERLIVACLIRGETQAAIARSLGLSAGRVNHIVKYTLAQLREWAVAEGFDGVDLGA